MNAELWDRSASRRTRRRLDTRVTLLALALVFGAPGVSTLASAQTWSAQRTRPALFEIVAVDATGHARWPYGTEDLAGDGASRVETDEAAIDLRSIYADARSGRLWLRAYVGSTEVPAGDATAFFFIDTDARTSSGGPADGDAFGVAFPTDPSPGGYERAVGVRGDGTSLGVFAWDATAGAWMAQSERPAVAVLETGMGRDPLRLAGDDHGYFQVQLELPAFELDEACDGTIFVRTWHAAEQASGFGDDAGPTECRASLNVFGDPEVLQSGTCEQDETCPAQGECRDGTCVFAYACTQDSECRDDERCTGGACVRVLERDCDDASDCDGLVCASGRCAACEDSGARACGSGRVCTPSGACVDPTDAGGGRGGDGGAGRGAAGAESGGRVRGGAFTCTSLPVPRAPRPPAWIAGFALLSLVRARRRGAP